MECEYIEGTRIPTGIVIPRLGNSFVSVSIGNLRK